MLITPQCVIGADFVGASGLESPMLKIMRVLSTRRIWVCFAIFSLHSIVALYAAQKIMVIISWTCTKIVRTGSAFFLRKCSKCRFVTLGHLIKWIKSGVNSGVIFLIKWPSILPDSLEELNRPRRSHTCCQRRNDNKGKRRMEGRRRTKEERKSR